MKVRCHASQAALELHLATRRARSLAPTAARCAPAVARRRHAQDEVSNVKREHPELRHRDAFKMAAERVGAPVTAARRTGRAR